MTLRATAKTGLGHLRRSANVAAALRRCSPDAPLALCINAPPGGLAPEEADFFIARSICTRTEMAAWLARRDEGSVVIDTVVLPGQHLVGRPLCIVLRTTVADKVAASRSNRAAFAGGSGPCRNGVARE